MKMEPAVGLPNYFIPKNKLLEFLEMSEYSDLNIVIRPSFLQGSILEIRALKDKTNEVVGMDIPEEPQKI